jgi:hypothetical protein
MIDSDSQRSPRLAARGVLCYCIIELPSVVVVTHKQTNSCGGRCLGGAEMMRHVLCAPNATRFVVVGATGGAGTDGDVRCAHPSRPLGERKD